MSFESELKGHLGHSSVTAKIGDRLHPGILPERGTLPAATYQKVPGRPVNHLTPGVRDSHQIRLQITVWAQSQSAAREAADVIIARMATPTATLSSSCITDEDDYEADTKRYGVILEFSCWFKSS